MAPQIVSTKVRAQVRHRVEVPETVSLGVVAWAEANMRTEAGRHLDFDTHPYMPAILADDAREKGFMCGSQVGKTTMGITSAYYFADTAEKPVRVIYTMHTDKAVEAFAQTRAGQAIRASEYLSKRIGDVNNVHRKTFRRREGDSVILFAGASANRQALSEPADMLIHDEVDFSSPEVLRMYEDRLAHGYAEDKRRLVFGTPTVPGYGLARYWEDSTQAEWLVRCPVCGDERPIEWPDSFAADAAEPHFLCGRGHELTWQEHISQGRWVATRPGAAWSMYHISRAMTPYWPAARIVDAYERETFVQLFANQVMGRPATSGELTVDEAVLEGCMDRDRLPEPSATGTVFLGADPGAVINYVIGVFGQKGQRTYLRTDEARTWEELAAIMEVYRVRLAVVDGAYDPTKAQEFAQQFPKRVKLAYYAGGQLKGRDPVRDSEKAGYLDLDRTVTLDRSANRLIMREDRFPRFPDERARQTFVSQMTAMVRGVKQADDGTIEFYWQETRADHYRHAHNYATVAADMLEKRPGVPPIPQAWLDFTTGQQTITAINDSTRKEETVVVRPPRASDFVPKGATLAGPIPGVRVEPDPIDVTETYPALRLMMERAGLVKPRSCQGGTTEGGQQATAEQNGDVPDSK